ncbi:MAG: hypothetical protein IPO19_05285 [Rhodoferax sp.]|nr:hypothetical protein [Rhodoferax sp.]MBK9235502.1 hypothetical protein [Rhodoferax sp.]
MTTKRNLIRQSLAAVLICLSAGAALATDVIKGIEQALAQAQQEKKGVTLYVQGQTVGGGVVRIEPGQWVELRSQQYGRIIVRLDRIDGLAHS